jgi:type II secretory ATPase GspE/PulE/Tfp pilus assembly ATPase PilB-like protein
MAQPSGLPFTVARQAGARVLTDGDQKDRQEPDRVAEPRGGDLDNGSPEAELKRSTQTRAAFDDQRSARSTFAVPGLRGGFRLGQPINADRASQAARTSAPVDRSESPSAPVEQQSTAPGERRVDAIRTAPPPSYQPPAAPGPRPIGVTTTLRRLESSAVTAQNDLRGAPPVIVQQAPVIASTPAVVVPAARTTVLARRSTDKSAEEPFDAKNIQNYGRRLVTKADWEEFGIIAPNYEEVHGGVILFGDGVLAVNLSFHTSREFESFETRVRRAFPNKLRLYVLEPNEFTEVKRLEKSDVETLQRQQREFFNTISDLAPMRTSDLHIVTYPDLDSTKFFIRRNKELYLYPKDMRLAAGIEMMRSMLPMAKDLKDKINLREPMEMVLDRSQVEQMPAGVNNLRMTFIPTTNDSNILLVRISYTSSASMEFEEMGYEEEHIEILAEMMQARAGIVCISGVQNSGKTTLLRRMLEVIFEMFGGRRHIVTLEEGAELNVVGATQVPFPNLDGPAKAIALRKYLRVLLRSDADVLTFGETRDPETADSLFVGADQGLQVFTTLHVDQCHQIPQRLINLGVMKHDVADPKMRGLIAQRLVGVVCPKCSLAYEDAKRLSNEIIENARQIRREGGKAKGYTQALMRMPMKEQTQKSFEQIRASRNLDISKVRVLNREGALTCERCRGSGTIGATVIAEMAMTDGKFHDLVNALDFQSCRGHLLFNGMLSLYEHALLKVERGILCPQYFEDQIGSWLGILKDDDLKRVYQEDLVILEHEKAQAAKIRHDALALHDNYNA